MRKRILSLILVLAMLATALVGCGAKEQQNEEVTEEKYNVRIMSNNLWSCDTNTAAWTAIGYDCSAPVRAEGFVKVYSETVPDVIGTQECTDLMQSELLTKLQAEGMTYEVIAGGRTPIFYNTSTLELVESAHELYPEACPGFEGSFNNSSSKSWTLAVFNVKETGDKFIFVNTHLWYMSGVVGDNNYQAGSDEARKYQMELAIAKLKEYYETYQCAAYLVGDLNATFDSMALEYAYEEGFEHAHDIAVDFVDETKGTHQCDTSGFGPIRDGRFEDSIDHILVYGAEEGSVSTFNRFSENYYVSLSDHLPVYIDVKF